MTCIICGKSVVRLFNIYYTYGNINHTVFDDLVEIFGDNIDQHFSVSDCVCNMCMNMLDNVAELKRRLWNIILNPPDEQNANKLGRISHLFASLKFESTPEDEEEHRMTPNSNLLQFSHSVPYKKKMEEKMALAYYNKNMYANYGPECSEIKKIFSKKRRRRKGHNWTRRTKSAIPVSSTPKSRSYSRRSLRSNNDVSAVTPTTEYFQGRSTSDRTRSDFRMRNREKELEGIKYYCNEKDCPLYCDNLDVFNLHIIEEHGVMPLYYCQECDLKYTTAEHLHQHKKTHKDSTFFCLMCGMEVANSNALQNHLDDHILYSVCCEFCDKSFLTKSECDRHTKNVHLDKRDRKTRRRKLILDAVHFKKDPEQVSKNFEPEIGDVDVTEANLKRKRPQFYQAQELRKFMSETFHVSKEDSDGEEQEVSTSSDEDLVQEVVSEEVQLEVAREEEVHEEPAREVTSQEANIDSSVPVVDEDC